jgi:leucyl aminopeptidase
MKEVSMFSLSLSTKPLLENVVDCYAYLIEKDSNISEITHPLRELYPDLEILLKKNDFTGDHSQVMSFPCMHNGRVIYIIIVGYGGVKNSCYTTPTIERYRRAIGHIVKEVRSLNSNSVAVEICIPSEDDNCKYYAEQATIAFHKAHYHFDDYITEKKRKKNRLDVTLVAQENTNEIQQAITDGIIIGTAINQARHWIDMPPSQLTPQDLAQKAHEVAQRNNLGITIFHEKDINAMGMGGLSAVSRGSDIDCALIILEYKSAKKNAPTLCFVGKGITFDSGGLSLKPADFMETMKEDMSGAAAVICAIDALAQLGCEANIIAIAPTSENLPSGKATKPGDIVTFYNGKTAEIKNTDAEGRLILADALAYAVKHYKPTAIVDLATLTGACSRALGPFYSGLFTQHNQLKQQLEQAACISGDLVWQLPMGDDYKKAIVSSVADICNIGNSKISAGATTAAHFLQNFVDDVAWAHIDIAGTAYDVPNISYYRPGATGVGVGLLVALAKNWK